MPAPEICEAREMSPQSRRREPAGDRGHRGASGSPPGQGGGGRALAGPPPNALFAEMLRAARELLAVRSPLDAELMVSELLGTWWGRQARWSQQGRRGQHAGSAQRSGPGQHPRSGQQSRAAQHAAAQPSAGQQTAAQQAAAQQGRRGGGSTARRRADIEEIIGEGLVNYAAEQGSPAALALLSGIACLGTPRQAAQAERSALALMDRGVARPGWAEHVGAVEAAECYLNSDAYGDRDEVVCVFSYAGQEQHALVVVVDYNAGGLARDGWVTSQVSKLLDAASGPGFQQIEPPLARRILAAALAATEAASDPTVSGSFPSYHAFIRARVRTLPPSLPPGAATADPTQSAAAVGLSVAALSAPAISGSAVIAPAVTAARRTLPWRRDRRAMLVAEFLASDDAEDLSDRRAASRCADHIVDYGCDRDFGRPLRVSPAKAETFLLDWLPRKVVLSRAEQEAMPHVLLAWVRWAGPKSGLDEAGVAATLEAVFESMRTFPTVYRDPSSFGLEPSMVDRLLPDGDLEALARRVLAFPLLRGSYHGTDLATLNPAVTADRRTLLAADHDDAASQHTDTAEQISAEHLERHLALADRLWRGDPSELWDAAQRLLDLGEDRHEVLHALIDTISAAGPAENDIAAALACLPPEEAT
jgi:hypothetical protein